MAKMEAMDCSVRTERRVKHQREKITHSLTICTFLVKESAGIYRLNLLFYSLC